MIQSSPVFSAFVEDIERIRLYVEKPNVPLVAELQQYVAATEFQFDIVLLSSALTDNDTPEQYLGGALLVACDSQEHALTLTEEYALLEQPVHWLVENTVDLQNNQLIPGHHFVDWRAAGVLTMMLSQLKQQANIHQDKVYVEHKLALLSDCLGSLSLTLSADGTIKHINQELMLKMGTKGLSAKGQRWQTSLPIPSSTAKTRMQQILADLSHTHSMTRLPPFPIQLDKTVLMVDGVAGPLPNDESLLILRQVAQWQSHEWVEQLSEQSTPVTLLLVNPDDFAELNRMHGREVGDQVLEEIMQCMFQVLRADDFASRYSGAVFAAHLPETNEQQGQVLASRMLQKLRSQAFSKKKLNLAFSFGLATLDSEELLGEQSPLELFRRANAALQAARSIGGGKLVSWQPQFDANILANLDRMSGKFSQAPSDDFRLMNLQWDIIRLIGSTHSLQTFSSQVCQLLATGLQSKFTGLYMQQGAHFKCLSSRLTSSDIDEDTIHQWAKTHIKLAPNGSKLVQPTAALGSFHYVVIPLVTRSHCVGFLLACWESSAQESAKKCAEQLAQVTPNLAAAIDRIMLLEQDENRRVGADKELSGEHELLFESPAMRTLMQQVQLVAPTDASVLIIGESGTGKEVIAQQIHNHSLHPDKPFITVDCSTIVEHLMESELFGHRRGAFTGATSDQPGKIAQADGGTLFLDEVGELPLDIQSKLLRFVQEKTFVAVGDQRVRKVDVRLVLATNRNLPDEVAQGRFRADLYYRINVFTLNLPALNERGNDPLMLARHFIQKFARQYNKDISDFSTASLGKLEKYHWPGNVRELRNCMMRAVILCSEGYIEPEHLILQEPSDDNVVPIKPNVASIPSINACDVSEVQSEELRQVAVLLTEVVALVKQQAKVLSVSNWLEKQWLNQCVLKWGSLYQVAQQLAQSESTIRRRYAKLNKQDFSQDELSPLTERCNHLFESMLDTETHNTLWPSIEATLHQIVIQQDVSQQQKAKLLDVTQPTLRKIIQQSQG
ncbi:Alginate biosynthesis transcriptional regulatory protein AlgB [Paraglaciecola mesophila]|uniref:Alginate biosynthesis transcriptional regulatory protein AlgB n=1 Tax=Paraglaciecola mesophila TaxID=197222 RepID=A0A857JP29_9ALTE|nr:sigma 54-interacting transcriptional regulator [Paraglaciecola mesophila]QHJ13128.1 Alginate biosynthesis transcriptional regulatory protein AlgB [Paraglaciecola mesophila]